MNKVANWIKEKWENFKNKEWVKKIRTKIRNRLEGKDLIDFIIDKIF
ncbi:hypothetical protein J5751_04300 [bacterium]|nr:hypothetical protein [bacterium]